MQCEGKIFLADERGISKTAGVISYSTFNSGDYYSPHKHSLGNLHVLNDHLLGGSASQGITVPEKFCAILIPVSGAISYSDASIKNNLVAAGQALFIGVNKEITITVSNPFRNEAVNFLQLFFKANKAMPEKAVYQSTYNDVNNSRNKPVQVFEGVSDNSILNFAIHIGKFNGRGEATYTVKQKSKNFFGFVLEGAFEIQGRLLHARDGLGLWNISEVEIEALSNEAILLIIETEIDPEAENSI